MRVVFIGSGPVTIMTAKQRVNRGDEVIIIESDRELIDKLHGTVDCSFLHGDGSTPDVLREADPEASDVLVCLAEHDQTNIIAGLVGRALGFKRVIVSIADEDYEPVCRELGLEDTIVPAQTISRHLNDLIAGVDILELRTVIKDKARLFSLTATKDEAGSVEALDLPSESGVVWYYRQGQFHLADDKTKIKPDDEVVIATHSKNLEKLRQRWTPQGSGNA